MLTLNDWLAEIELTPRFNNSPAPERIKEMLQRLHFNKDFFCITLAGTNGKGTTSHLLAAYYQQQGYKVGLFTSPHLLTFNERITINGKSATDAEIISAFAKIKAAQQTLVLSYFDYSLLASLLIFEAHHINIACLEVGIGGRLDATNAIDTDLAIITTIDIDHQEQLGTTRAAIGHEKAGIMRANTYCVCGDTDTPNSIIEHATQVKAKLLIRERDFTITKHKACWDHQNPLKNIQRLHYPKHIPLQNAATALMSILVLENMIEHPLNLKCFNHLMDHLTIPGRMQVVQEQPQIIIDVAHNPQSAQYLASQLTLIEGKTYALFSCLSDKDIAEIIKPLTPLINTWYIFELSHHRAASAQTLQDAILAANSNASIIITPLEKFYSQIKTKIKPQDRLVVFGSFLTINAFLSLASDNPS